MGHSLLFISTMSQLFGILRPYPTYSFPFYKSWRKLLPTTDSHLLIFQICICKTCSNCVAIYTLLAVLWPTIKKLFYLSYLHCLYINIKNIIICKGIQILMIKSYKNALPVHPLSISSFSSFPPFHIQPPGFTFSSVCHSPKTVPLLNSWMKWTKCLSHLLQLFHLAGETLFLHVPLWHHTVPTSLLPLKSSSCSPFVFPSLPPATRLLFFKVWF